MTRHLLEVVAVFLLVGYASAFGYTLGCRRRTEAVADYEPDLAAAVTERLVTADVVRIARHAYDARIARAA